MNFNIFKKTLENLNTLEQKQQFTFLVAVSLHNSLEKISDEYFLKLKQFMPKGEYLEYGDGILTVWNYQRSYKQVIIITNNIQKTEERKRDEERLMNYLDSI